MTPTLINCHDYVSDFEFDGFIPSYAFASRTFLKFEERGYGTQNLRLKTELSVYQIRRNVDRVESTIKKTIVEIV